MNRPEPACERGGLLLSLRTDGAATPDQIAELEGHLAECADCRRAARTDRAVGDRLRERAAGAVPAGFSARVVAAVIRDRAAAAAQNRFLRWTAAAAVFVAAVSVAATAFHERDASMRETARDVLLRPRILAGAALPGAPGEK